MEFSSKKLEVRKTLDIVPMQSSNKTGQNILTLAFPEGILWQTVIPMPENIGLSKLYVIWIFTKITPQPF